MWPIFARAAALVRETFLAAILGCAMRGWPPNDLPARTGDLFMVRVAGNFLRTMTGQSEFAVGFLQVRC